MSLIKNILENKTYKNVTLIIILILGTALRLININNYSLWYDELQSVAYARLPIPDIVQSVLQIDCHPPLYYIILHFFMLISSSDVFLRLSSVVFGVLGIFSVFMLAEKICKNVKISLLATLLIAISPYHIWYSQEIRMYSIGFLFASLSFYITYRILNEKKINKILVIAYLIITYILLSLHGSFFFIIVTQNIYFLILHIWQKVNRQQIKLWLFSQLMVWSIYLPYLYTRRNVRGSAFQPSLEIIPLSLSGYLVGMDFRWIQDIGALLLIAVLGMVSFHYFRQKKHILIFVFCFTFVPIIIAFAVSYLYSPIYSARTLMYTSIPLFFMIPAILFIKGKRSLLMGRIVFLIYFVVTIVSLIAQYRHSTREDWKGAAQFTKSCFVPGKDLILTNFDRVLWTFNHYFLNGKETRPTYQHPRKFNDQNGILIQIACTTEQLPEMEEILRRHKRLFIIRPDFGDTHNIADIGFINKLEEYSFREDSTVSFFRENSVIHYYKIDIIIYVNSSEKLDFVVKNSCQ